MAFCLLAILIFHNKRPYKSYRGQIYLIYYFHLRILHYEYEQKIENSFYKENVGFCQTEKEHGRWE